MTATAITVIKFHNQALSTVQHNGQPYVAMKPIVEAIGLDWDGQRQRIRRHQVLSEGAVMITAVAEDGRKRQMSFLPLKMLNGWLFGIDVNRVKPEIRDTLIDYQRECFDVLNDYWNKGVAINPRQCLTPEQQRHIQELVNRIQHQRGTHWNTTYHNIKTRFQVGSYKDVRAEDYPSLCHFLGGAPLEGEWMPKQSNSAKPYSFPASLIRPSNAVGNTGWLTLDELNKSERPLGDLLNQLEADGHDVGGAKLEYLGMQKLLASSRRQLDAISGLINDARHYGLNVTLGDGSVNTSGYIDHQGRG